MSRSPPRLCQSDTKRSNNRGISSVGPIGLAGTATIRILHCFATFLGRAARFSRAGSPGQAGCQKWNSGFCGVTSITAEVCTRT